VHTCCLGHRVRTRRLCGRRLHGDAHTAAMNDYQTHLNAVVPGEPLASGSFADLHKNPCRRDRGRSTLRAAKTTGVQGR